MNVAIISKTFLKGGAEKQALILTKLLVNEGINVCLVNWYGEKIDKRYLKFITDNSFNYFPLKGNYIRKLITFIGILKEEEVPLVISYLTLPNFVSGISKLFLKKLICIGGIRNEKLPYHKFFVERLVHNFLNDATVFNNYSAREKFIKRGFKSQKIHVIHNAITSQGSRLNDKISNGEIKIITVGRFVRQKDYKTALKAFRDLRMRNTGRNLVYYIIGYGPLENTIKSYSEKFNIKDNVRILINPSDIPEILLKSDIFLSTSLFEGVSNSIMEAMAAGLPIVATNVGDNGYLVRNGHNGFIVPCKSIGQIVEKLEYLCESEEIRKSFGRNSIKVIEEEFSKKKFLDSYLNLFSDLLDYRN